eukprot:1149142-Pelagomonas_calceolata.AAC.5
MRDSGDVRTLFKAASCTHAGIYTYISAPGAVDHVLWVYSWRNTLDKPISAAERSHRYYKHKQHAEHPGFQALKQQARKSDKKGHQDLLWVWLLKHSTSCCAPKACRIFLYGAVAVHENQGWSI